MTPQVMINPVSFLCRLGIFFITHLGATSPTPHVNGDWRLEGDWLLAVRPQQAMQGCRSRPREPSQGTLLQSDPFLNTPRVDSGLGMSHNCRDWPDCSPSDWCQATETVIPLITALPPFSPSHQQCDSSTGYFLCHHRDMIEKVQGTNRSGGLIRPNPTALSRLVRCICGAPCKTTHSPSSMSHSTCTRTLSVCR